MTPMTVSFSQFDSLDRLYRYFQSEKVCRNFLARHRWKGGIRCPICGGEVVYECGDGHYHCEDCNRNFTVTTRTIFASTKLPLRKWYAAIWLTINNKKGVSALMLSRELGITPASAWHMLQKIRMLLPQEDTPMEGDIQVDAGYVGGSLRWINGPKAPGAYLRNKISLLGFYNGSYRIRVVEEGNWKSIGPVIHSSVVQDAVLFTDMGNEFKKVDQDHFTVDHSTKQWKDHLTGATTSAVESCWSHIKRHHHGIYHKLTHRYAQRYVDEFVYRYNTLHLSNSERTREFFDRIYITITWKEIAH